MNQNWIFLGLMVGSALEEGKALHYRSVLTLTWISAHNIRPLYQIKRIMDNQSYLNIVDKAMQL